MKAGLVASIRAFTRAVLSGALAAAAPMLPVTIMFGVDAMIRAHARGDANMLPALYIVMLPLVVTLPLVLAASLIVGLPLAALLKRIRRESERSYMACGGIVGALIPIVGLLAVSAPAGYWVALLGALGGAVTGWTWWLAARKPR